MDEKKRIESYYDPLKLMKILTMMKRLEKQEGSEDDLHFQT